MMTDNILALLQAQDYLWLAGVVAAGVVSLVQGMSKKYKPWTWVLNQLGRGLNAETNGKLDDIEGRLDEQAARIQELATRDAEQDAKTAEAGAYAARRRILRFADEIRCKQRHSEEYFNDVLSDIHDYTVYCDAHPGFQNDRATMSIDLIKDVWKKCVKDDDFL